MLDAKSNYIDQLDKLADEALIRIGHLNGPIIQFCGPISTGGLGNVEDNIFALSSYVNGSLEAGLPVFDQMEFENEFNNILKDSREYDYLLLEVFYKKIISSEKIKALFFIPMWESSKGSVWEHEFALSLNKQIFYLEQGSLNEIIDCYKKIKI